MEKAVGVVTLASLFEAVEAAANVRSFVCDTKDHV